MAAHTAKPKCRLASVCYVINKLGYSIHLKDRVFIHCFLIHSGVCEGGVDAAEVGLAVADAEGEVVDVGDAGAGVGVSTL